MVPPHEQFTVQLSQGTLLTRLPIGETSGRWWVPLVLQGERLLGTFEQPRHPDYLTRHFRFDGPEGKFEVVGGSLGGDNHLLSGMWELRQSGQPWLRITYADSSTDLAVDVIKLPAR